MAATTHTEPAFGFISRLRTAATPYVQPLAAPLSPYVTRASDILERGGVTMEAIEDLTELTKEKCPAIILDTARTHAPTVTTLMSQLDSFGCVQLDRLEVLGTQSNQALSETYTYLKNTSEQVKAQVQKRVEVTNEAVKQQLNTTVEVFLPEEASASEVTSSSSEVQEEEATFRSIGTKVYARAAPIVSTRFTVTKAYVMDRIPASVVSNAPSSETILKTVSQVQQKVTQVAIATTQELHTVLPPTAQEHIAYIKRQASAVDAATVKAYVRTRVDELLPKSSVTQIYELTDTSTQTLKSSLAWFYGRFVSREMTPDAPVAEAHAHDSAPSTPPSHIDDVDAMDATATADADADADADAESE